MGLVADLLDKVQAWMVGRQPLWLPVIGKYQLLKPRLALLAFGYAYRRQVEDGRTDDRYPDAALR